MEKEPLISVIIPHYNTIELLRKAILSAKVNDCVEVIVIDDKSKLAEEQFATLEQFCRLNGVCFYRNNTDKKGAGVCRNIGLDHMQGKWLLLLDADDYFIDGWFEAVRKYLDTEYDMVYFKPIDINLTTGKSDGRTFTYQDLVTEYVKHPSRDNEAALKFRFCSSCSKLIRASVFKQNNISFDETLVSNDVMFMTKCAYHSKRIAADETPIYMVTRSGKTLTSGKNVDNLITRCDVLINRYHYLENRLSVSEFKTIHLGWLAIARLADTLISGYGIKDTFNIYKKFKNSGLRLFDKEFFYPINVWKNIKTEMLWHMGITNSNVSKKG